MDVKRVNFELLCSGLDVDPLLSEIDKNTELWNEITGRQDTVGSPHKYTKSIFLRWAEELTTYAAFNKLHAADYPALSKLPSSRSFIHFVENAVGSKELGKVLIVLLEPGGFIAPHVDEGLYADKFERFHICLSSDEGNFFNCGDETVHMKKGELWYFNHKGLHSLVNKSATPRIHLIIDCVAPRYRKERT